MALVLFYKTVKSRDEETLRFAPILRDGGFSSYDLKTKLKPNQIKDLLVNDCVITVRVIWGLNWRVRLVNLLYLIYVEIEHANFQPSQVRMNRIQTILVLIELDIGLVEVLKLRRFSFFLFFFKILIIYTCMLT